MIAKQITTILRDNPGLKAREITRKGRLDKSKVNAWLYGSSNTEFAIDGKYRWWPKTNGVTSEPVRSENGEIPKSEKKQASPELTDIACPICGYQMLRLEGRYGIYLRCNKHPSCDSKVNLDKNGGVILPKCPPLLTDLKCKSCQGQLYLRSGMYGLWLSCSSFPQCRSKNPLEEFPVEIRALWVKQFAQHSANHPLPLLQTIDGTVVESGRQPLAAQEAREPQTPKTVEPDSRTLDQLLDDTIPEPEIENIDDAELPI